MKSHLITTFIKLTFVFILFNSCAPKNESPDIVLIREKLDLENQVLNYAETVRNDGGHSSSNYSVADTIGRYTVGYKFIIPDSVRSKNLKLYVSAWVRESAAPIEGGLAIAVSNSKGILLWNTSSFKGNYTANTWVNIRDSVLIGKDLLSKESSNEIRVFGLKDKGSDVFNIDDIEFECKIIN